MQAQRYAFAAWIHFVHTAPIPMWAMHGAELVAANSAALSLFKVDSLAQLGSSPGFDELIAEGGGIVDGAATRKTIRHPNGLAAEVQLACWPSNDGLRIFQALTSDPFADSDRAWFDQNHDGSRIEAAQTAEQGLLSSIADCIQLLTFEGRLLYVNPGGRDFMAVEDATAIPGADWLSLWEGEHRASAEAALRQAQAGGAGRFVALCAWMDGEHRWWDVVVTPIRDAQGRVQRLLSVSRDVTDVRRANLREAMERSVLELIANNAALDRTLDQICHLAEFSAAAPGQCCVLIVDEGALRVVAAPSLPALIGQRIVIADALDESIPMTALQQMAGAGGALRLPLRGPDYLLLGMFVFWITAPVDFSGLASSLEASENLTAIALTRSSHFSRLRAKQERLKAISRAAPVGIYQVSSSGAVVYANERHQKISGMTPEEWQGEGWLYGVHPDDREAVRTAWKAAHEKREEFRFEYRQAPCGDGLEHWVLIQETPLDSDYLGSITDITGLKAAQSALTETASRFETLANNMSQFCWMADSTGSRFWYNDRWYDYTGTTFEAMKGWGWRTVHHPDHVDRVLEKIHRCFQTGEVWEDTFPLRGKDGTYRWFLSRAVPIRDEGGRVLRWFGTNTDITEQRQLESAMRRQNVALQQSNEDLSRFAFIASHDLQEPVRSIVTFAQLLQRQSGETLDSKSSGYLDSIIHAGTRMHRLIRDLLVYAQASSESGDQFTCVDLNPVYSGVIENLRSSIEEAGASITCEAALPEVRAVEVQVTQIFQNLLSNSIKYRREGVAPVVRVSSVREGDHWRISIQDNGQGFPAEYSSRVFEFMKRLHGREVAGSGIGLAVCKTFVERNGGTIGAESTPGEGSTFWFTLPAV